MTEEDKNPEEEITPEVEETTVQEVIPEEEASPEEEKTPEELIEGMQHAQHPVTNEDVKDAFQTKDSNTGRTVGLAAIIATAVVMIGCIFACAAVAIAFIISTT